MHPASSGRLLALILSSTPALAGLAPAVVRAEVPADPHAHCREVAAAAALKRARASTGTYALPDLELVRDDGRKVRLADELADGKPVVLDFVFTTCKTICPVMSQTFARLQERLGEQRDRVHLVSVSIDPEQDTPARLAEYARRFHARPGWRLYTGTAQASVTMQRAFDAFRGDKMDHTPVTFVRTSPGDRWLRVDGFATADELAQALRAADRVAAH